MGAWGDGLFQSDSDYDVCGEINADAAKIVKDPDFRLFQPEDPAVAVSKLDSGLFGQLFSQYKNLNWGHGIIFLTALAMEVGARISEE